MGVRLSEGGRKTGSNADMYATSTTTGSRQTPGTARLRRDEPGGVDGRPSE
ncbi:hypothetical protein [Haloarcula laminariae]|uniref:hypothetical protein n=1 Tax=Haloarcula laminariae TaxID=2961577 RepID=UPI0021C79166|nr:MULTISPECIES: hypothetical protein [Halomicroarcula]